MIEGVGPAAYNEIIAKRPFHSLEDLLTKVDKRVVNKRVMFKLIFSGCLDQYFPEGASDLEKLQKYMEIKAKLEGKKTPEAIPDDFRQITALKRELIRKSVFKIYSGDLAEAATQYMLLNGLAEWDNPQQKNMLFVKNSERVPIVRGRALEARLDSPFDDVFAIVGFVAEAKEVRYSGNTKTMMKFLVEVQDHLIEAVKWPPWKKNHHEVDFDPEECACLFMVKRRGETGQLSVLKVIKIEETV
jgi:DNA polymerase III alpha subunit